MPNKGYKPTTEHIANRIASMRSFKGNQNPNWKGGLPSCIECEKTLCRRGFTLCNGCSRRGSKNYLWISDRTKLKRYDGDSKDRRSPAYADWRKQVWQRDNYKCKIDNKDCDGRLEVHHILNWSNYSKLRYQVNNGITLCHAHHPRKVAEEKRLIPEFQDLVSVFRANSDRTFTFSKRQTQRTKEKRAESN